MASARSSAALLCVCSILVLLLVADVAVAAQAADLPQQQQAQVTGKQLTLCVAFERYPKSSNPVKS